MSKFIVYWVFNLTKKTICVVLNLILSQKRQQSTSNFRKRHLLDENEGSQNPTKRSRSDLMEQIVEELDRRYINWHASLPIEVIFLIFSGN